jgi:hypothetical protein
MIIVLLFVGLVACACWACWHLRRTARLLGLWPSQVARPVETAATTELPASEPAVALPADDGAARVSVRQLERAAPRPPSVLGWEAFSIVSALALEGTALIGCRRETADEWGVPEWRRGNRPSAVAFEIGTLVLLIGEDSRAIEAVAMLEEWRMAQTSLILRPTAVTGAIELFDGRSRALRACLLAG